MYKQIIYFVSIILILLVIYKYKSIKERFQTGNPNFCNSRDLQVWIEIKTGLNNTAGGAISKVKFYNGNTAVTDNTNLSKVFGINKQQNTGWKQIPVKSNCPTTTNNKVFVNKIKITCSNNIKYQWLTIKVKSGNIIKEKKFYNGNISNSRFYSFPVLRLKKQ